MSQLLRILLFVWLVCLFSCRKQSTQKTVLNLFFTNNWDSLKTHVDEPTEDFKFILETGTGLERTYNYSMVGPRTIVMRYDGNLDSVHYVWNEVTGKIHFDSVGLRQIFSEETKIRALLVDYNINTRNPRNAWLWLTYPKPLNIDSLYGNFFCGMYHTVDIEEYTKIVPRLEAAWKTGHENSGLALGNWYVMVGEREEAIRIFKNLATRLNTEAMVRLGEIYDTYFAEFGYDPPEDALPRSSFIWYCKAANLDDAFAMHQIGFIYERGINHRVMIDSAFYWYRKSSNLGEAMSSVALANLFLKGEHVKQNLDSGMSLLKKAITQDPSIGYLEFGKIYEKGVGVDVDILMAKEFYRKADSSGSPVAKQAIKRISRYSNSYP